MNRVRFRHPTAPFFVDLSIIQSSPTKNRRPLPKYTLREAGVFQNQETYEVELELDNQRISKSQYTTETLMILLRQHIRLVLAGIQQTQYPIGYQEMEKITNEYMDMIHGQGRNRTLPIRNRDFLGPSSYTLQLNHIMATSDDDRNVRKNYCVTDKADGSRMLLYVSKDSKLYMIDTNMRIMYMGCVLANRDTKVKFQQSLLDGEFIQGNKQGKSIQLFAAFDMYYHHNQCVSHHYFMRPTVLSDETKGGTYRLELLQNFVTTLNENITHTNMVQPCTYRIQCKRFESHESIFTACRNVLARVYEYTTDGLIFTPMNAAVGADPGNKTHTPIVSKISWEYSFKWKPPEYNTVDFLVKAKRHPVTGEEEIAYQSDVDGVDVNDASHGIQP